MEFILGDALPQRLLLSSRLDRPLHLLPWSALFDAALDAALDAGVGQRAHFELGPTQTYSLRIFLGN